MKKLVVTSVLILTGISGFAQNAEQEKEKRVKEFHRVINMDSKDEWKKFVVGNYTKALIEKAMKARTVTQGSEGGTNDSKEIKGTVEDKVNMLERLHKDFGGSKIVSIKPSGENLEMELSTGDISGVFKFKFEKIKPFLIDGLGVQVEGGGR